MTRPHPPGPATPTAAPGPVEAPEPLPVTSVPVTPVTPVVEVSVADRIAAAVLACPLVAGLHGGQFGEVATYLPGRRVPGVRLSATEVAVHLVGRYPAPVAEIDQQVRAAVAPFLAGLPLMITIEDYAPAAAVVAAAELPAAPIPAPPAHAVPAPVEPAGPTKEIL